MTGEPDFDPKGALDSIRSAQAGVAERFTRGGWVYDVIYAGLVGAIVGGFALPLPFNLINEAVLLCALAGLALWWKRRTGVWLSGVWPARARWVAVGLGVLVAIIAVINTLWSRHGGGVWVPLGSGLAAALLAFTGARLWTRVYRRESGLDTQ